jgi:arginyl-tRNA synthetase
MQLIQHLKQATADAIQSNYQVQIKSEQVLVNATKPEIEGDYTIVLFAFVKQLGKSPDELGLSLIHI